jgi:hypothetical protein
MTTGTCRDLSRPRGFWLSLEGESSWKTGHVHRVKRRRIRVALGRLASCRMRKWPRAAQVALTKVPWACGSRPRIWALVRG